MDWAVLVCGYGCRLSPEMELYLNKVVEFVKINNVRAIITSGGKTNRRSAPGISEAGLMADYLKAQGVTMPVYLDGEAITTTGNIEGATQYLTKLGMKPEQLVIFCDSCRSLKVKLITEVLLGCWPTVHTFDLTKHFKKKLSQYCIRTPLEILALYFPVLKKGLIRRREEIMDKS